MMTQRPRNQIATGIHHKGNSRNTPSIGKTVAQPLQHLTKVIWARDVFEHATVWDTIGGVRELEMTEHSIGVDVDHHSREKDEDSEPE